MLFPKRTRSHEHMKHAKSLRSSKPIRIPVEGEAPHAPEVQRNGAVFNDDAPDSNKSSAVTPLEQSPIILAGGATRPLVDKDPAVQGPSSGAGALDADAQLDDMVPRPCPTGEMDDGSATDVAPQETEEDAQDSDSYDACDSACDTPVSSKFASTIVYPVGLIASGSSERGSRARNEDSFDIGKSTGACEDCLCVSDGIGGAPYGDIMSKLCCSEFLQVWKDSGGDRDVYRRWRVGEWCMWRAFSATDAFVSRVSKHLGKGSGATLVAAARCDDELVFARVGDSTAYVLMPEGGLVHVFGDSGRVSTESNALKAAMGYHMLEQGSGVVRVQTATVPLREGMRVLLCTDGVWTQLGLDRIAELLAMYDDPYSSAYRIVREAVEAAEAQSDNATAVVARVARLRDSSKEPTPFASISYAL